MNEWISVEDRLPECHLVTDLFNKPSHYISDVVLVCVKSTECDGVHYSVSTDFRKGKTSEEVEWYMSCGYGGSAVHKQEITHWMPLPPPPTERDELILINNSAMLWIGKEPFRCSCGSNVFSEYKNNDGNRIFKCHGCKAMYEGE